MARGKKKEGNNKDEHQKNMQQQQSGSQQQQQSGSQQQQQSGSQQKQSGSQQQQSGSQQQQSESQQQQSGSQQQQQPGSQQQQNPNQPQERKPKKSEQGIWFCSKCDQKNYDRLASCKKCKEPKPKIDPIVANPSPSRTTSESSTLSLSMQNMQISSTKKYDGMIESNPDGRIYEGKRGVACKVEVNYTNLVFRNLPKSCFHYDVTFIPETPKKMLPAALHEFMRKFFQNYVYGFDGRKNMYTNQRLTVDQHTEKIEAHLGDRSREFEIKIQYAAEVDMQVLLKYKDPVNYNNDKPAKAIQALDIILRSAFRRNIDNGSAVPTGRVVFFVPNRKSDLGDGMELWLGLFQSAVLGRSKIYLNVDVLHKAFPSALPVLELLRTKDRNGMISDVPTYLDKAGVMRLNNSLSMLSIGYRLKPNEPFKTYGFNRVGQPASSATFEHNGRMITIEKYFEVEKKIKLRYPNLPVLEVGSKVKKTCLPIEFCEVPPGQATNKKCTPEVTRGLIKYSATSTDERKRKIRELLDKINYAIDPTIKGFGIEVNKEFEKTDARVIDPPKLKYQNELIAPRSGVWKEGKFLEVNSNQNVLKWAIINVDNRTDARTLANLKDYLVKEAKFQGIYLENLSTRDIQTINLINVSLENILGNMKNAGCQLVVVVVNDFNNAYARVKQAAELSVGILTQCIKSATVRRLNPSIINNILLKLNAKLNGKNHEIEEISYKTINKADSGVMFVGADVTHPSPDQRDIPSVVGVASSYDQVGFKYCCAWRLQNPKEEMIDDLENILVEHLTSYKKANKRLPVKLMYYRDGVSDGQFNEVLQKEMTAIRKALKRMYGLNEEAHAKVTFIVVQKRHHTRFFPTSDKFSDGRNKNVLPGTVVDKDIVHPFQYQFFLASHAAIQGVAKPTKYCILINESNISPDDLQAVTYDLCHLFTRCSRSVSYPAPTYYAHLVAARGKNYIIGRNLKLNNLQKERNLQINPEFVQNSPMFFV